MYPYFSPKVDVSRYSNLMTVVKNGGQLLVSKLVGTIREWYNAHAESDRDIYLSIAPCAVKDQQPFLRS